MNFRNVIWLQISLSKLQLEFFILYCNDKLECFEEDVQDSEDKKFVLDLRMSKMKCQIVSFVVSDMNALKNPEISIAISNCFDTKGHYGFKDGDKVIRFIFVSISVQNKVLFF